LGGAAICVWGVSQSDRMCIGQQPINEKAICSRVNCGTHRRFFLNFVTEEGGCSDRVPETQVCVFEFCGGLMHYRDYLLALYNRECVHDY
jgi:hypothetical protein